ncbi:SDR family NAD(P)-dependent oxidoreductase [Lonepinella koalarum]|uniref:SDR family NAD(P)-dependent oxidoreductase n=1 Tax=Lonepinella koalarum TaxID=53417 RepID=UPI0011E45178|nr:SDR family NAD(P)-dependent oxidoreductase [Lonepinella koalarum]TYG33824.1 SDR family NAD(P)-dependent oxidoreductase [Lonepinella koalarum]
MVNKAVVIGGSNGVGLSVVSNLLNKGYFVYILDISEPDKSFSDKYDNYAYISFNLLDFDYKVLEELKHQDINILFISAGIGRVALFSNLDRREINKIMQLNATSIINVIHYFYDRISQNEKFYTGVMVSIAGLISSPFFSVYSASKAALSRFIESVNIELECNGISNRILNISPGSIKGTKFNGGQNSLGELDVLSKGILLNLFNKKTLYIPQYSEIYANVLERYKADPHKFGVESYQYKLESNRVSTESQIKIGYLSGTFDLFHIGHLNLLRKAKEYCDYLIVGVHPSAAHKGKETFISFEERKAIVESCKYVDQVVQSCPEDNDAWKVYEYHYLFVGGDYKGSERFNRYEKYFEDKNVQIIYFPYTQGTSSSQLRNALLK